MMSIGSVDTYAVCTLRYARRDSSSRDWLDFTSEYLDPESPGFHLVSEMNTM